MSLLKAFCIILPLFGPVGAWHHELGLEQHLASYRQSITRQTGLDRYPLLLIQSCLPQQRKGDKHLFMKTLSDSLCNLYHCCYLRGMDCTVPKLGTPEPNSCQRYVTFRAPCGHITLHIKHAYIPTWIHFFPFSTVPGLSSNIKVSTWTLRYWLSTSPTVVRWVFYHC